MKFQLGKKDQRLREFIKVRKQDVPLLMRIFMIEAYRDLIITTPVDTGRARAGWNVSFNSPDHSAPPEGTYPLNGMKAAEAFTVDAVSGKEPLYLTNNVPYIGKLNNGSSRQAPARFFEITVENAMDKLKKAIAKRGYN